MPLHTHTLSISFGDCDPAGIVYYPNFYRWADRTFHTFLQVRGGGHKKLCADLNSRGFGLMEAQLQFRSPGMEGDDLVYAIESIDWAARSFTVNYRVTCGDRLVLEGYETRGVFVERDGRLAAGDVSGLREVLMAGEGGF